MDNLYIINIILTIAFAILVHSPIHKRLGYGESSSSIFFIIGISILFLDHKLLDFVDVLLVNHFFMISIIIIWLYKCIISSMIPREDIMKAHDCGGELQLAGSQEPNYVALENSRAARVKINQMIFGKFAWDNFKLDKY